MNASWPTETNTHWVGRAGAVPEFKLSDALHILLLLQRNTVTTYCTQWLLVHTKSCQSPANLTCTSLDCGRRLESPDRSHTDTERTCKLHTDRLTCGSDPRSTTLPLFSDGLCFTDKTMNWLMEKIFQINCCSADELHPEPTMLVVFYPDADAHSKDRGRRSTRAADVTSL